MAERVSACVGCPNNGGFSGHKGQRVLCLVTQTITDVRMSCCDRDVVAEVKTKECDPSYKVPIPV